MQQKQTMTQQANSYVTYKISFYQKRAFATQQQEAQQITCASDVKGRKPYLIISGKLMKRESGGKLIKVNDCVSSAAQESVSQPYVRKKQQIKSQSATQPKNAPGGSHVAP